MALVWFPLTQDSLWPLQVLFFINLLHFGGGFPWPNLGGGAITAKWDLAPTQNIGHFCTRPLLESDLENTWLCFKGNEKEVINL